MNPHLALVKTITTSPTEAESLSDMDIILSQALLMEAGSATFKAMKPGENAEIITGLVALAYNALLPLTGQNKELMEQTASHQTYHLLAIMRLLSWEISHCASGKEEDYSRQYHSCSHFATDFVNVDFDKAFRAYHEWLETNNYANTINLKALDLTDFLYE